MKPLKEACVESLKEAIRAEQLGADRLELCGRLDLDGISPSKELVEQVLGAVQIPIRVMVRPRAGGFVYTEAEKRQCFDEIRLLKKMGIEGIVIGALNHGKELDIPFLMDCFAKAKPLKMTIHKAIDVTANPVLSVQMMVDSGYTGSILTSGGAKTALEGLPVLGKMLQCAGKQIEIIPAGRITSKKLESIHKALGATIYHGRQIIGNLNL